MLLWKSILKYNINGKVFRIVSNMYTSAKSYTKLTNNLSGIFKCDIGVRQGENLLSLLFALLLNDFDHAISEHYQGLDLFNAENKYVFDISTNILNCFHHYMLMTPL